MIDHIFLFSFSHARYFDIQLNKSDVVSKLEKKMQKYEREWEKNNNKIFRSINHPFNNGQWASLLDTCVCAYVHYARMCVCMVLVEQMTIVTVTTTTCWMCSPPFPHTPFFRSANLLDCCRCCYYYSTLSITSRKREYVRLLVRLQAQTRTHTHNTHIY